jgi:serine phosphatase RsbU (regulator of sigma subunit)
MFAFKKHRYFILLLLLLLPFAFFECIAQKTLVLSDTLTEEINLSEYLYYKKQKTFTDSFISTFNFEQWKKNNQPTLNLGFSFDNYLIYTAIKNVGKKQNLLLYIPYPFLDTLDVYIFRNGLNTEKYTLGDRYVFNKRIFSHRNFVIPLTLNASEKVELYFHIKCNGEATSFPLWLTNTLLLDKQDAKQNLGLGIYYGIILFALGFTFFLIFFLKEGVYLIYLLYLTAFLIFQGALDGLTFEYLFQENIWLANHVIPISGGLSLLFLLLFVNRLLNINALYPSINRMFKIISVLIIIETLMAIPEGKSYSYSIPFLGLSALFIDGFLFAVGIYAYKKNHPQAGYFIAAFGVLLFMLLLTQLKNFNLLPRIFITEYGLQIGSSVETILLSLALSNRIRILINEKNKAQQALLIEQQKIIEIQQKNNIELEEKVKKRTQELIEQKEVIEEKNKDITDSINYAERIQRGILQSENQLKKIFSESFILFKPKDIVSGDFYWFADLHTTPRDNKPSERLAVLAVIDCTGHGIPGAFMSMLGNAILNQTLKNPDINTPADALNFLNEGIVTTVTKKEISANDDFIRDGMDIAMIAINHSAYKLWYAGANLSCYIVRNIENEPPADIADYITYFDDNSCYLLELKPDKQAIGVNTDVKKSPFNNHFISLCKGDSIYLFSDGYADQFGGPKSKKYTSKRFKQLLGLLHQRKLTEGKEFLWENHLQWKGLLPQIDDITVLGIRIQ